MIDITFVLIGIVVLFALFIVLRSIFSLKVCALCGAVSLTWIVLLVLLYLDYEINPVLTGLLMGGSIVGVLYLLEEKLSEKYQIFKLPFFLTLISLAYFIIMQTIFVNTVSVILSIWLLAVFIHAGRQTKSLKVLGRKIIECCKNW
jgi:hypothetical protein